MTTTETRCRPARAAVARQERWMATVSRATAVAPIIDANTIPAGIIHRVSAIGRRRRNSSSIRQPKPPIVASHHRGRCG